VEDDFVELVYEKGLVFYELTLLEEGVLGDLETVVYLRGF